MCVIQLTSVKHTQYKTPDIRLKRSCLGQQIIFLERSVEFAECQLKEVDLVDVSLHSPLKG